jgi:hypothetical protein
VIVPHIKNKINRTASFFDRSVNREEKCMFLMVMKSAVKDKKESINRVHNRNGINLVERKNVEKKNIESAINAASVYPFTNTA